ncbi:MAG TPA: WhiB family transcriptional regulator [Actinocrinis sp.]|nr:WhiB family transcriptional regulator [Actinocrinis sp.]
MADFSRLPGPNADLWDWQLRGLCRGKDSSLFFHPEGERGAARSSREAAAKEICLNCPVQIPCAEHALKVREPYGVWGGMTEEEREEHHARQKALARAQAAREKAARAQQERLKEKLLRDKARATAASAQDASAPAGTDGAAPRSRPVVVATAKAAPAAGPAAQAKPPTQTTPAPAKPAGRKKSPRKPAKSLVKA